MDFELQRKNALIPGASKGSGPACEGVPADYAGKGLPSVSGRNGVAAIPTR